MNEGQIRMKRSVWIKKRVGCCGCGLQGRGR